ncbi:hypothetical protein C1I98_36390 [Spongiactinospora gelatinilytica]|uniref:Uncharacterized protein n=1 Tax=Spongiactinospora gelatinilytica TaxID=2666298 RepID=A0A2W2EFY6_9ACTN|nr:hypothetical protein [Spongiactinospora gelatinilytica]PZG23182.1 hypothetical protein C1I98_36390 [Spongiactinospora gelatinilytica]
MTARVRRLLVPSLRMSRKSRYARGGLIRASRQAIRPPSPPRSRSTVRMISAALWSSMSSASVAA